MSTRVAVGDRPVARHFVGAGMPVDRFVTDDERVAPGTPADELGRAEVLARHERRRWRWFVQVALGR
jgi:hypothetical protein